MWDLISVIETKALKDKDIFKQCNFVELWSETKTVQENPVDISVSNVWGFFTAKHSFLILLSEAQ